jgi:hypothetical protein
MAQARLLAPGQAAEGADRLYQRLKRRRDPIRLKELCFRLMWMHLRRAEFERCVEVCDEGIALAAQLASDPVQYPTLKALALMDLGRFGEAWDALQREVADTRHPFGAAMRALGVAEYLNHLGAVDRAAGVALEMLAEARRLSRTWMQQWMVDLLTALSPRVEDAGLCAHVDAALAATPFQPRTLAVAQRRLWEGNAAEALQLIGTVMREAEANGLRQQRIVAMEAGLRALARLERWTEIVQRAEPALVETEATGLRAMQWRILGHRARARLEAGDHEGAVRDAGVARHVLAALAASVPDAELRASLENDPTAREVRAIAAA